MNQSLKKVNEERVLFFDCEVVRRSKELDINSREFDFFQKIKELRTQVIRVTVKQFKEEYLGKKED